MDTRYRKEIDTDRMELDTGYRKEMDTGDRKEIIQNTGSKWIQTGKKWTQTGNGYRQVRLTQVSSDPAFKNTHGAAGHLAQASRSEFVCGLVSVVQVSLLLSILRV